MGGDKENKRDKLKSIGLSSLGAFGDASTRDKVAEGTGLYTPASKKKEKATQEQAQAQAQITAQAEAQALRDAETRQRMNIFKTAGGSDGEEVGATKKRRIFGN